MAHFECKNFVLASFFLISTSWASTSAFGKTGEVLKGKISLAQPFGADVALNLLKEGNRRYLSGSVRSDGQSKLDILRLFKGQSPNSVILSCSDSRVPPELVFDQKL